MCGIAGLATTEAESLEAAHEAVQAMTDAQRHRGPDDEGVEVVSGEDSTLPGEPLVILGHRRLSIIDLSPGGHQPMHDGFGATIVFNGEIYNYRELRRELAAAGASFRSESDTEVILRSYSEWGEAAFERLQGIFALAIWDHRRQRLVLARDHLGVKPLYYAQAGTSLVFASEVRALLRSGRIARRLDPAGLRSFLAYGSVQDPLTLIAGISSLGAGHCAVWRDGTLQTSRYWTLPLASGNRSLSPRDREHAYAEVGEALQATVGSQLVADVPVGTFLSGGIDSSVIAALARKSGADDVCTLGIALDEPDYDERKFARMTARHIGSRHVELVLTGEEVKRSLPQALAAFDQPSVDGLNTYFVSRLARDAGLTVALSGLGGDEVFGGYNAYGHVRRAEQWERYFRMLPSVLRRALAPIVRAIPAGERAGRAADLLASGNPYFVSRRVFDEHRSAALLVRDLAVLDWEPARFRSLSSSVSHLDEVSRASALELQTYLLSTLLRDADQMSMAHGLEIRVPFLDHKLIERVFSLPGEWRLETGRPKPLLTRPFPGLIPEECVLRQKRGFGLPFAKWFHEALGAEIRAELVDVAAERSWPFRSAALHEVWTDFDRGALSWSRVWNVFMVRRWLREHEVTA